MRIELSGIGKKFKKEWVFKNIHYEFPASSTTAVVGPNGSGKSTLLKIISASELPTVGDLKFFDGKNEKLDLERVYSHISYAAPYMELPEQLKLSELFQFHKKMKPFNNNIDLDFFLEETNLKSAADKLIYHFSSGMKQRLKLGLAIFVDTPVLILDEPCSNLDSAGVKLYKKLMGKHGKNRIVIIGSNQNADEMLDAKNRINILDYK